MFHTRQEVKLTSDLSASCDLYMKQGLTDACYSDELLTTALQFMPKFRQEMDDHFGEFTSPAVGFIQYMFGLIQFSNQRCIHNMVAAITANKSGMREKVLGKFTVPPKTRQMLKYSSFTSESVFGHLPKKFLEKFTGPSQHHLVARDRQKNNAGHGKGRGKRSTNDNYPGQVKKSKYGDNYVAPKSSVFHGPASNPKGGGAGRGRGKSGGRGRAKN